MRTLVRALLLVSALTWWVLPGMGVIDLTVTWDPAWPVMLETGWGVLFTVGLGLPFALAAFRPQLARAALVQLYVVAAALLAGVALGLEPEAWWVFVLLLVELPLVHAVARRGTLARARPHLATLVLAGVATPAALAYAWEMAARNRLSLPTEEITNGVDHYAVQAAFALALVALPAVGSCLPRARRLLGTSAALMAGYVGLVSTAWPDVEAGFSVSWSVAVLLWAAAVLAVTWWSSRATGPQAVT